MAKDKNTAVSLGSVGERIRALLLSPIRVFQAVCFSIGFGFLLTVFGFSLYVYFFYRSLPEIEKMDFGKLKNQAELSVFYKLEDKKQPHHWVDLKDVSRDFIYAIVMSEDSAFFDHSGVDFDAIMNSLAENIRKKKYEYGGSTISQQVAKNVFLKNEKKLTRKAKELLLTSRIEGRFNKNQILEIYLNIAEFGRDLFGISEAAKFYFNKKPTEINAAEGVFIALMLPSPRKYQYALFENKNLPEAKRRRVRRVLGDMLANELISAKQYHQYTKYDFFRFSRGSGEKLTTD